MDLKKSVLILCFLSLPTSNLFSQDTLRDCNCWTPFDVYDTIFQIAALTEGPAVEDKGSPPNYYNDNGSTLSLKLPFPFCFYGKNYDSIFINNNGNVSFTKPIYNVMQHKLPFGVDSLILAPFYADVYTWGGNKLIGGDRVFYQITPTYMIVKWNEVGFYSPGDNDEFNNFQLIITDGNDSILPPGNNVAFCYNNMMWATTSDTSGFGGYPATIGVNRGNKTDFAQFGTFSIPGTQYLGPFQSYNGLGWLIDKSFIFNTCINGNTIPPVIVNEHTCDTVTVCAGDSIEFTTSFLSPKQGQTSTLSISSPGLTGVSIQGTTNVYNIAGITVRVAPSLVDVGTHIVNVIAKDNSSPALINKHPITIFVRPCSVGINEIVDQNKFSIYPNPSRGKFIIELASSGFSENMDLKVYDLIGANIDSRAITSLKTDIDLSLKSEGVYFLKLYKNNILVDVEKIMIVK
ncbi:MAG: T9SS type A sorting domain-containing protein [Bacteroidetes bacterium]|nr:T9SS type A sorting domain-containing protein [Bacteroidota bacterium]